MPNVKLTLAAVLVLAAVPLAAKTPSAPPAVTKPYHLELEATPAAVFPYLSKFGKIDLHVYNGGVRAETLWLNSFSRNGAPAVTVANPLGRMYVEMPIRDIAPTLTKLAGEGAIERKTTTKLAGTLQGTVKGVTATRYRLSYGPSAYIDYWTTSTVAPNPQLQTIVDQLLRGISPGTAEIARKIPGTPLYVELNFRRFKKVPLLRLKRLTFAKDDEDDALTLGPIYVRASLLEAIWK
ncbi:MAG TPA: hypothetical protein VFN10_07410 [Thermoanaerobaculia bacterium]|nr:hypothetical protein [Thermoanaerobaculia bacterium]